MDSTPEKPRDVESPEDQSNKIVSPEDPSLTEYDKTVADSFPASDPPAQP